PRRVYFTAADPAQLEQALGDAGLETAAAELQRQLRLPTAALIKRIAPEDPLLRYPAILERLEDARAGPLKVVDGQLVAETGEAVILFASVHSPFQSKHQGPLQERIAARFAELASGAAARGERLRLRQRGAGRFALRAEAQIRGDVQRHSIIALIGVCIDYPIHLFCHHALEPDPTGPIGTARRIRVAMVVGALTTVAGFVGLGWTSFPGVREIGVFAAVGVLPSLMAARPKPVAL